MVIVEYLLGIAATLEQSPHRAADAAGEKTGHAGQYPPPHIVLLSCLLLVMLLPFTVWAQSPCTHWASPSGSGSACSQSTPCRVNKFWPLAQPGTTLCLLPGTYQGGENLITPPQSLAGREGQPITIRAEQDGTVLLDAQHNGFAVWLSGTNGANNDWFVVEGINARNGLEAVYRVSGDNNTLRRVIGWNGTEGQNDSNIIRMTGQNNWCEDCAGWGWNSRKILDMAQGGNVGGGGFLRAWAEWNDHPGGASKPDNTILVSYNTGNARFYNMIGTWDAKGDVANAEGVMEVARQCDGETNAEGTKVKGALLFIRPGATYQPGHVVTGFCASHFYLEDVASLVPQGYGARPFLFYKGSGAHTEGSVCQNCLGVHGGTPSQNDGNSGWSMPGFREGGSLSAATGGSSPFELLPGQCKRYDRSGTLTSQGLWPWPLNQRIKDARVASGYSAVDVTADVEKLLGPIPQACKGEGPPPSGDTVAPTVAVTAPANQAIVSGTAVAVRAEAADDSGTVAGVTFLFNGEPVPPEQPGPIAHVLVDSTKTPNGVYTLAARARDQAGNVGESAPITVVVYNGAIIPPTPPTGDHPPLNCVGALQSQGAIVLKCLPEVTKR